MNSPLFISNQSTFLQLRSGRHSIHTSNCHCPLRQSTFSPQQLRPSSLTLPQSPLPTFTSSKTCPPTATMSDAADIYQQIYDIDIAKSGGIPAVLPGQPVDKSVGYITVNEGSDTSRPRQLFSTVVIPPSKRRSYELASALFDNYDILSSVRDEITPDEQAETDELLSFIVNTPPMQLAREYISSRSNTTLSDAAWYARVRETWFRPFAIGSSPSRSGFEHVFLGEWKDGANTVGGLHWWYYFLDKMEDISYRGAEYRISDPSSGLRVPELATMSFSWRVEGRDIYKRIGGFFVGPSVEGLMAMGMVRAAGEAGAPSTAYIEGMEIDMKMYKSDDGRSVNTFYPILRRVLIGEGGGAREEKVVVKPHVGNGKQEGGEAGSSGIRIVSVMANPGGNDVGREKVTLMNLSGEAVVQLNGWQVVGPNNSRMTFGDVALERGEARTFRVPGRGSLQLSNKGGDVSLVRADGIVEQVVEYKRDVAKVQDGVLVWDGSSNLVLAQ